MMRSFAIGIGVALALAAVGLGVWLRLRPSALGSELAKARKEGFPLSIEELKRTPPVPMASNAAFMYERATEMAKEPQYSEAMSRILHDQEAPRANAATLKDLKLLSAVLDKAAQATNMPDCDFDRDWSLRGGMLVSRLLDPAVLFDARATARATEGDLPGAMSDIGCLNRMAKQCAEGQSLIDAMVFMLVESHSNHAVQKVAELCRTDSSVLSKLSDLQAERGDLPSLKRVVGADCASESDAIWRATNLDQLLGLGISHSKPNPAWMRALRRAERERIQVHWVAACRRVWRTVPTDPDHWQKTIDALNEVLADAEKDKSDLNGVTVTGVRQWRDLCRHLGVSFAQRRMLTLGLALMRQRALGSTLEAAWAKLATQSLDPFSGKPFLFERVGSGFRLKSVGKPGLDKKGLPTGSIEKEFK